MFNLKVINRELVGAFCCGKGMAGVTGCYRSFVRWRATRSLR